MPGDGDHRTLLRKQGYREHAIQRIRERFLGPKGRVSGKQLRKAEMHIRTGICEKIADLHYSSKRTGTGWYRAAYFVNIATITIIAIWDNQDEAIVTVLPMRAADKLRRQAQHQQEENEHEDWNDGAAVGGGS